MTHSSIVVGPMATYAEESSWSDVMCNQALDEIIRDLGIDGQDRDYLVSMPRICTYFYLLGSWIEDEPFRRQITHAICLHNFGIKLLDDVVDDDTSCSGGALAVIGSLLCDEAYAEMSRAGVSTDYFLHRPRAFVPLWRDQFDLDLVKASSIEDWMRFSELRICRLLVFYSTFLNRQRSATLDAETTAMVFNAIGDVWTIFDDFRDREKDRRVDGNRHANLALLVETGEVGRDEVEALLEERYEFVRRTVASHPPALDFFPFFENVVQKCRANMPRRRRDDAPAAAVHVPPSGAGT